METFTISCKAPTRIDLFGGTLDVWPLHQNLTAPGTANCAITLFSRVALNVCSGKEYSFRSFDQDRQISCSWEDLTKQKELPLITSIVAALWKRDFPSIHISVQSESPCGAGIGGSSSLALATVATLFKAREILGFGPFPSESRLVSTTRDLEAKLLKVPTGCQDYWAALRGGLNIITYPPGQEKVTTLQTKQSNLLDKIGDHLILAYTGISRFSGSPNWTIFRRFYDNETATISALNDIDSLTQNGIQAIQNQNWFNLLEIVKKEWQIRKCLFGDLRSNQAEKLEEIALNQGAILARLCGAGGGGVMAVLATPEKKDKISDALTRAGGTILNAKPTHEGLRIADSMTPQPRIHT